MKDLDANEWRALLGGVLGVSRRIRRPKEGPTIDWLSG